MELEELIARPPRDLLLEISYAPVCPHCQARDFYDWQREANMKFMAISSSGRLKCHGCGKFFSVTQYLDGAVHSSAWRKAKSHHHKAGEEK